MRSAHRRPSGIPGRKAGLEVSKRANRSTNRTSSVQEFTNLTTSSTIRRHDSSSASDIFRRYLRRQAVPERGPGAARDFARSDGMARRRSGPGGYPRIRACSSRHGSPPIKRASMSMLMQAGPESRRAGSLRRRSCSGTGTRSVFPSSLPQTQKQGAGLYQWRRSF